MADLFNVGVRGGSNTDLTVSDVDGSGPGGGSNLNTGDLRRKFNFGDRVSELALAQDPFFRFLSKVSKKRMILHSNGQKKEVLITKGMHIL